MTEVCELEHAAPQRQQIIRLYITAFIPYMQINCHCNHSFLHV